MSSENLSKRAVGAAPNPAALAARALRCLLALLAAVVLAIAVNAAALGGEARAATSVDVPKLQGFTYDGTPKTPLPVAVSCGSSHTAYVTAFGDLYAVGYNNYGQLGDGTETSRLTPVKVASGVASVSCGYHHTAYVTTSGDLYAMGSNDYGQLGDGTETDRTTPVKVARIIGGTVRISESSTTWAVNAGTYSIGLSPAEGCVWSDGTTGPKTVTWSISQVSQAVSAGKAYPATNYNGSLSRTVSGLKNVSASGGGALSYSKAGAVLAADSAAGKAGDSFSKYFSLVPAVDGSSCQIKVAAKTPVGTYSVKIRVKAAATENYRAASKDVTVTVKVARFAPTIHILGKVTRTVGYATLKTKSVTVDCPITKIQCASKPMSYALSGAKDSAGTDVRARFKVNATTGAVTVAKDTAKGAYKVRIKVMSDDNANYKGNYKIVECTVKVS